MKTKDEKGKKNNKKFNTFNKNNLGFWKTNWVSLVLLFLSIIVIASLVSVVVVPYVNKKSLENDIAQNQVSNSISVDKIAFYSSAYAENIDETKAMWNLNLSQYTDMAIYLNVSTSANSMYIDNISFSNTDIGNLSLSYIPVEDFGKVKDLSSNNERIELDLATPITLRYLNSNLKENCIIADTETPLSFDGSLLKRGKVTLSSIKNTVSFKIHVIDSENKEHVYPMSIPIELENKDTGESIYNGYFINEITY